MISILQARKFKKLLWELDSNYRGTSANRRATSTVRDTLSAQHDWALAMIHAQRATSRVRDASSALGRLSANIHSHRRRSRLHSRMFNVVWKFKTESYSLCWHDAELAKYTFDALPTAPFEASQLPPMRDIARRMKQMSHRSVVNFYAASIRSLLLTDPQRFDDQLLLDLCRLKDARAWIWCDGVSTQYNSDAIEVPSGAGKTTVNLSDLRSSALDICTERGLTFPGLLQDWRVSDDGDLIRDDGPSMENI